MYYWSLRLISGKLFGRMTLKNTGKKMKKTIGVAMAAACVASAQMAQAQTTAHPINQGD